jgi:hypothetical protein
MGHPAFVAGEASWPSLSQLANASRLLGRDLRCLFRFSRKLWQPAPSFRAKSSSPCAPVDPEAHGEFRIERRGVTAEVVESQ